MKLNEIKIGTNALIDISDECSHKILTGKVVGIDNSAIDMPEVIIIPDNTFDIDSKFAIVARYASFDCTDLPTIFDLVSVRVERGYLYVATSCESLGLYHRCEERLQLSCRGLISLVNSRVSSIPIKTRDISKSAISFYTFNDPEISVGCEFTLDVLHSLIENISESDVAKDEIKRVYVIEKIVSADYNEILAIAKVKENK